MQRLEDRDLGAVAREVARAREAGGAGAHDRDLADRHRRTRRRGGDGRMVAHEALEPADRDRLHLLDEDALHLALAFLRTDAAAHGREVVVLADDRGGAREVADEKMPDEARDVDGHRAALDAGGPQALDAALGLRERVGHRVAEVHLEKVVRPLLGVPLGHVRGMRHHVLQLLVVAFLFLEEQSSRGCTCAGSPRSRASPGT